MRVLCCGSRDFTHWGIIHSIMAGMPALPTIVHGGARGADLMCEAVAQSYGYETEAHPADWNGKGKAAGFIRNQAMLDSGVALCYAFVNKPLDESRGTADMVARCRKAGVPTWVIQSP